MHKGYINYKLYLKLFLYFIQKGVEIVSKFDYNNKCCYSFVTILRYLIAQGGLCNDKWKVNE